MNVPLLDLSLQHAPLHARFMETFEQILRSGRFILGPQVEGFEAKLAAYCHTRHALGVSSGTDALLLAMMALEIGPGDEVITTPFTFFCTAGCIARLGATPIFVDIDPETFNLDPDLLERAITPRTRAVIPVHLFGQMAEMKAILRIARANRLAVIEDAAQAIGAGDHEQAACSLGDIGCLSFYPSKNLSGLGDGGAVLTNRPDLHERLRMLRVHGEETRYHHAYVGGNFRLDAIQAAMLAIKIEHLDGWSEARRRNARRYIERMQDLPLELPFEAEGKHHVFNQFTVRVSSGSRDALRRHLNAHGIGHEVYYPVPLHLQKCFAYLGHKPGDFPQSERAAREVLSLPIFPELTQAQQDEVIRVLRAFFQ